MRTPGHEVTVLGTRIAMLSCLLALSFAGCATTDRERDAAAVADSFHAALAGGDGQAACAELNPETASKLERREKKPCEEAILALELPRGGAIADARVYVTSAFAQRAEGGSDFLDRGPNGWMVSAAGCDPTAPERPYDCELED